MFFFIPMSTSAYVSAGICISPIRYRCYLSSLPLTNLSGGYSYARASKIKAFRLVVIW